MYVRYSMLDVGATFLTPISFKQVVKGHCHSRSNNKSQKTAKFNTVVMKEKRQKRLNLYLLLDQSFSFNAHFAFGTVARSEIWRIRRMLEQRNAIVRFTSRHCGLTSCFVAECTFFCRRHVLLQNPRVVFQQDRIIDHYSHILIPPCGNTLGVVSLILCNFSS